MMKVMAPAQMKMKAGSRAMLVSLDRLLNVSFSDQAQIPIARMPRPSSWRGQGQAQLEFVKPTQKMTLKPKMTYLRQQETSLVSLILRRLFWFCGCVEGIPSPSHRPPITLKQLSVTVRPTSQQTSAA